MQSGRNGFGLLSYHSSTFTSRSGGFKEHRPCFISLSRTNAPPCVYETVHLASAHLGLPFLHEHHSLYHSLHLASVKCLTRQLNMHASTAMLENVIEAPNFSNTSTPPARSTPTHLCLRGNTTTPSSLETPSIISSTHSHSLPHQPPTSEKPCRLQAPSKKYSPSSPRTCLCSPTKHQGSFRCRLHRDSQKQWPHPALSRTSAASEDASGEDDASSFGSTAVETVQVPHNRPGI